MKKMMEMPSMTDKKRYIVKIPSRAILSVSRKIAFVGGYYTAVSIQNQQRSEVLHMGQAQVSYR